MPDHPNAPLPSAQDADSSAALSGLAPIGRWIAALSAACARRAGLVACVAGALFVAALLYDARAIAIDTDSAKLISADLPWRKREAALDAAFAQRVDLIAVVIDGATPQIAERAAATLTERLSRRADLFRGVRRPDAGDFFERNGLLFLSLDEVAQTTEQLIAAQALLGTLAKDPSPRGLMESLTLALEGVRRGETQFDVLAAPLAGLARTLDGIDAGRPEPLAWQALVDARPPDPHALRRFVLVQPHLDFHAISPGEAATGFIRDSARDAGLDAAHGVRVRLTGEVPMADEEFATLQEHAGRNAAVMIGALLGMLWLALRSLRAVAAVVVNLVVGLALTAAYGLVIFGTFNLISVAFAVLFVGLGVDFGIQYAVAWRAALAQVSGQGPVLSDAVGAARSASGSIGVSLALAAASIAAGFFAFAPTDYRGISELGVIAGIGMLLAFLTSVSLLPALLKLLGAGTGSGIDAPHSGLPAFAPLDRWMVRHRRAVLVAAALLGAASLGSLPFVRFDFNPLHLRSPTSEAVATLADLAADPQTSPDTVQVLAPSLTAAQALADRLARLPQVAQALTLASFVPEDQPAKLERIADARLLLADTLRPAATQPAPSDAENAAAMAATSTALRQAAAAASGPAAADATHVAASLQALAAGPASKREAFDDAVIPDLRTLLAQANASLQAEPVSLATLPESLRREWVTSDGRARIEVFPRSPEPKAGQPAVNTNESLRAFVAAVRTLAPEAGGTPVAIQESAGTVVDAFIEAGVWTLLAVVVLLFVVLRRPLDVLRTLASLLLGGAVTLGCCAWLGIALNFANIIALPLLFGIGVAFNIYFVLAWRRGVHHLLQTSIARAVVFSALTTATAFGSLWLSSHPGTASMGELLVLSLICAVAAALFVLPALLGPPPLSLPPTARAGADSVGSVSASRGDTA